MLLVGGFAVLLAKRIPGGFVPDEDNGYFFANIQLPDASSLERTDAVAKRVETIIGQTPGIEYVTTVTGYSLVSGAYASNTAFLFVSLKPWEDRKAKELHAFALMARLNQQLANEVKEAFAVTFGPPPIIGLGSGSGFTMMLQDRSGGTPEFLAQNVEQFLAAARKRPEIGAARTVYRATVPQIFADIDRDKVTKLGIPVTDVNTTLGALLGGAYVNDFNRFGRTYKVYLQAEPQYRADVGSSRSRPRRGTTSRSTPCCRPDPPPDLSSPTASTCTARPRSPECPRSATARRRHSLRWRRRRRRYCRRGWATAGRTSPTRRRRRRGRRAWCSLLPSSWCSWSWRPSTRAGRCP